MYVKEGGDDSAIFLYLSLLKSLGGERKAVQIKAVKTLNAYFFLTGRGLPVNLIRVFPLHIHEGEGGIITLSGLEEVSAISFYGEGGAGSEVRRGKFEGTFTGYPLFFIRCL